MWLDLRWSHSLGLHVWKCRQWLMSSSFMLKGPISSDSRAPPSGLKKLSLWGSGWRKNFATTVIPYWLAERELCIAEVHSPEAACKPSRAPQGNVTALAGGGSQTVFCSVQVFSPYPKVSWELQLINATVFLHHHPPGGGGEGFTLSGLKVSVKKAVY